MTDQSWWNNWLSAWDLRLRRDLCVTRNFCVPCNLSCLISDIHVHFYQTPICVVHMVTILNIKPLENETSELDEWSVLVEQLAECLVIAPSPTMPLIIHYSLMCVLLLLHKSSLMLYILWWSEKVSAWPPDFAMLWWWTILISLKLDAFYLVLFTTYHNCSIERSFISVTSALLWRTMFFVDMLYGNTIMNMECYSIR
jgi:hypothetical protein